MEIIEFIPFGKENAISRPMLVAKCQQCGLVTGSNYSADVAMRELLRKARIDYVVLYNPDGGYYRPLHEDILELQRYIRMEDKRAISIFKSIKRAKALYDDWYNERITDEGVKDEGLDINS